MGSGDSYKLGSGIWRITRCNFTLQHPTYGSKSGRIAGDYILLLIICTLLGEFLLGMNRQFLALENLEIQVVGTYLAHQLI